MPLTAKQIKPMFNDKLEKKQRREDVKKDTGSKWGQMPRQELTDELKNDLKAI